MKLRINGVPTDSITAWLYANVEDWTWDYVVTAFPFGIVFKDDYDLLLFKLRFGHV